MKRTVSEVISAALKEYGTPFCAGIPGHGNWALVDAFHDPARAPRFVQVMHEQSASHMADACFRLTGKPGAVTGSIGPGAVNTLMGMATAYSDSSAALYMTGAPAVHFAGHGVMQSLDRKHSQDFLRLAEPASKAGFHIIDPDTAPNILHRAYNAMISGRPGPAVLEVPFDVQVATTEIPVQPLDQRMSQGRARPDARQLEDAIAMLLAAERPCLVAGGGVITAEAAPALKTLAETLQIPVTYTWNGKGAFPDDHPLCAGGLGVGGSTAANELARSADVLLVLGCRFTDWTASSFRRGVTFSIPPSKLIHVDIDPTTIGRSYPASIGIVADIRSTLDDLVSGISKEQAERSIARKSEQTGRLHSLRQAWADRLKARRGVQQMPTSMLATLEVLRRSLPREAVVTVGSGHCQAAVKQGFDVYAPRTHITSGGYSTMGFALPAAMASKVVQPDLPAVAIIGDGDFLMSAHELATCVMQNLSVIVLVLNNEGFLSIRDGQNALFERETGSSFTQKDAEAAPYSADLVAMAKSFGLDFARKATTMAELETALRDAGSHQGPVLIEVPITKDPALAGAEGTGWWDFPPSPTASQEIWQDYAAGRAAQQHLGQATDKAPLQPPLGIYG